MIEKISTQLAAPIIQPVLLHDSKLESPDEKSHKGGVELDKKQQSENSQNSQAKSKLPDYSEIEKKMQEILHLNNQSLQFSVDDETKKMVVKVVDNNTKEVVRQFPAESVLKVSRMLMNSNQGHVTDARV